MKFKVILITKPCLLTHTLWEEIDYLLYAEFFRKSSPSGFT